MDQITHKAQPITVSELTRIPEQGDWLHAVRLYRQIIKIERAKWPEETETEHTIFTLSYIYLAGYIDGVRRERARRREHGQPRQSGND